MALEESAMVWISDIAARIGYRYYKASDDTDEAAYNSEIATGKFNDRQVTDVIQVIYETNILFGPLAVSNHRDDYTRSLSPSMKRATR